MKFKRTLSRCKACPLDGRTKVLGTCGIDNPKVVIIGEAPGEKEEAEGEPFAGPVGGMFKQAVAKSGHIWHMTHRMNVLGCRPPNGDMGSDEAKEALKCCRLGFEEELEALKAKGVTVLVPTGNAVLSILGIDGKIGKVRGSVFPVKGMVAVPAYHPSYVMKGMWHEEPTWIADLAKAKEISLKNWEPPKEKFNLFPTVEDVKKFCTKAIKGEKLVAVDIETTSLSPYHSKIIMVGFALNGEEVLVVPFTVKGGHPYWDMKDEIVVRGAMKEMLAKCPTMFQNGMFDIRHLEEHGYRVEKLTEDTMLAHHAVHPELPHNLEYIVSVYGKTPAWKHVVKGQADRMIKMDDREVRTYNARDTAVLHQVIGELHKDLEEMDTMKVYRRFSMRLVRPLLEMTRVGMLVDKKRITALSRKFKRDEEETRKVLMKEFQLPDGFNFDSPYHMQKLVHGIAPKQLGEWKKELAEYDEVGSKKKKTTKKYTELAEKVKIFEGVVPLYQVKAKIRTTAQGKALDDEAFLQIQQACLSRLDALEGRVRITDEVKAEQAEIRKLLRFVKVYGEWSRASKMAGTYGGYPVGPDGRVHPNYKIHGTATGRLSCADPNLQNQPEEVQEVFVAGPGRVIIKADYSNIELRVLAYLTGEPELIRAFESGVNIHDVNTMALFGIDKSHPNWKNIRRAAKIYVFGRSYGGGVEGIYKQVLTEVPELEMSLSHFKECDRRYFEKMAKYREWTEDMRKKAREQRCVETAFGFKRLLLGSPEEIERQALNTPIQGTAGQVAEEAICDCWDSFQETGHKKWKADLVCTVHDSILVECEEKYKMAVAKEMKRLMEKEWEIGGRKVRFPVDVEIGPSWGETEVVEV